MVELVDPPGESPAPGATAKKHRARLLVFAALFLTAFLSATFAIRSALPPYLESSHIRESYRHLERYNDHYDTLFFGSSRAQFQIDPDVVDATLKAHGLEAKSFNFGISALNGLELEFVLNQALALPKRQLRRVVIDLGDMRWRVKEDQAGTEQVIARHDTRTTWRLLKLLDASDGNPQEKQLSRERHEKAWFDHITSEGRGAYWLTQWVLKPAPKVRTPESYDGFEPLDERLRGPNDDGDSGAAKEHRRFLKAVPAYQKRVDKMAQMAMKFERRHRKPPLSIFERELVERVVAAIRKTGAEPIFYIAPRLDLDAHFILSAKQAGLVEHVLNYADPASYPQFYDPNNHFDEGHLNSEGAKAFSAQLAEDIALLEKNRKVEKNRKRPKGKVRP